MAIAAARTRPTTELRSTRRTAQTSAPMPVAAIRKPSVWAPPPSVRPARIGVSALYGALNMPTAARKTSSVRIGVEATMYCQPSRSSCHTSRRSVTRGSGGSRIDSSPQITAM